MKCPWCDGFGYFEDGTPDGRECERCSGNGVVKDDEDADEGER